MFDLLNELIEDTSVPNLTSLIKRATSLFVGRSWIIVSLRAMLFIVVVASELRKYLILYDCMVFDKSVDKRLATVGL